MSIIAVTYGTARLKNTSFTAQHWRYHMAGRIISRLGMLVFVSHLRLTVLKGNPDVYGTGSFNKKVSVEVCIFHRSYENRYVGDWYVFTCFII